MIGFGTSLYLLTTLAQPIVAETGWYKPYVISGLTCGLVIAGLTAPFVGTVISQGSGRCILVGGAMAFALGQIVIGLSPNLLVYFLGWIFVGIGMGSALYTACFGTLGHLYGANARTAISVVAIVGGLASTVFWPLSQFLIAAVGWRTTCFVYASLHIIVCVPIYAWVLPATGKQSADKNGAKHRTHLSGSREVVVLWVFGGITALEAGIAASVAVHFLTILETVGVAAMAAAALGALIGPAQISIRFLDGIFGQRLHPVFVLCFSSFAIMLGLLLMAFGGPLLPIAMVSYGFGIGIFSIVSATLPLRVFGRIRYPALMGRITRPTRMVQAAAPFLMALVIFKFSDAALLPTLIVVSLLKLILSLLLAKIALQKLKAPETF
jgi:predicted MFS family arabinose efflux permease